MMTGSSEGKRIWFGAKCLLLYSVLLRQGVMRPTSGLYSKECLHTAACWMAHGDLRRALNMTYQEFYDQSIPFIQKHREFVQGGQGEINEVRPDLEHNRELGQLDKCELDTKNCQGQLISDAAILGPTKPPGLVHECPADTLNYMLLLCASDRPGYWPQDIYDEISPNHPTCGIACDHMMTAYHAYHLANGKIYPQDFPQSWTRRLGDEKAESVEQEAVNAKQLGGGLASAHAKANVAKTTKSTSELELPRDAYLFVRHKQSQLLDYALRCVQTWVNYLPNIETGQKFIGGDIDSDDEKIVDIRCKRGTWITSVKDKLPSLVFGYCNGPHQTDQSNNFIHVAMTTTTSFGVLEAQASASGGKWIHCRDREQVLPKIPGEFSFMTGVTFKTNPANEQHKHTMIAVGNWRCGGWADWTGYSKDIAGKELDELTCPHLTAMCSIQYASSKAGFGNDARVITYIRIGCCEIPWNIYYAATNFFTGEIINNRALTQWASPKKSVIDRRTVEELYPSPGTQSYFCPPGEFIFGVSLAPVEDALSKLILLTRPSEPRRSYAYFSYPVLRLYFYCKGVQPKTEVSILDPNFYSTLLPTSLRGEPLPKPPQNGCPSYAVGLDSRRHFSKDGESGAGVLHGEYTMHCSDRRKSEKVEGRAPIHQLVLTNSEQGESRTNFDCPPKFALCGVQCLVEGTVREGQPLGEKIHLLKGSSWQGPLWTRPAFSNIFGVPVEGYYMAYICCPIPVLIMDQSCPQGVGYDIKPNEQKLKFCKDGVTTCEFGEIFGYTIKNETQVITNTFIQPHYPGYDQEILASMAKATKKFLDTGFEQYLTLNQYTEPNLEEEGTDLGEPQGSGARSGSRRQEATGNAKFFGKFMKAVGILGDLSRALGATAGLPGIALGVFNTFFGEGGSGSNAQLEAQLETNRILTDISSQLATMQSALVTTTSHHYSNVSTRTFAVGKGSSFVFYDMVLTCGDYSLTSGFNIEYITHSPDCEHNTLDEYKWQDVTPRFAPSSVDVNYTKVFSGFGTSISGVSDENAIENVLPWNVLTRNGTLRNNLINAGAKTTHFSLVRAPLELFERANFTKKYLVNFVVPKNHLAALYRVEITCKPWTVKTNDFYLRVGPVGSDFSEFGRPETAGWIKYPLQGPLPVEPSPKN